MSGPLKLHLATRPYDGVLALLRGAVNIPGVELQTAEMLSVAMFTDFHRGQYDVSEMSLAESVYYISHGRRDFTCLPVFPSRYFRHGYWFLNRASGIDAARPIEGQRIGFQRWVQTAGVWMRGQLRDEHGVVPAANEWYVASVHHWDEGESKVEPRDGSEIRIFGNGVTPENAHTALADRRVDLMGTTEIRLPQFMADPRLGRFYPDYRKVEAQSYAKTGIFPIMHLVAMRSHIAEAHAELPAELFKAFVDAKAIARQHAAALPSHTLAWRPAYVEEEAATFGTDPWRHGLESNRKVIETFIGYCYDQGIAARRIEPEELFHPSTWHLLDNPRKTR